MTMIEPTQADILRSLDRAIDRIMGIEIEAMSGDNLAVTLCSHFDRDDGSELCDNGWSETATNAYNEIKQEIAGLFVPVREAIAAWNTRHTAPAGEVEPVAWKNYAEDGDWWLTDEQEPADSCERSVPLYTHPTPPADLVDLVTILHQYRSDMLRPPAPDSRERRIAMIDAAIAKFGRDA